MKILRGQRWRWRGCLVEALEDSREFDSSIETVRVLCRGCEDAYSYSGGSRWVFGKGCQDIWEYLEGQDKPLEG